MSARKAPLSLFHPVVAGWFDQRVGRPTQVQAEAWPRIAAGSHVLVTAPTGSGKTLTAFLWALDRLLTGAWQGGTVRVLYVSPLRALNNDIRRNLLSPLADLEAAFAAAGTASAPVSVMTRSGDTPGGERQRMLRRPPEILITTPESLNILLTSQGGRSLLGGLQSVVLDEIHAVAGSKRGTHLITAVERLVDLSGEFQRLALSATVRPLERVAAFVGGHRVEFLDDEGREVRYVPRAVEIVRSAGDKRYQLTVESPLREEAADPRQQLAGTAAVNPWEDLVEAVRERVKKNRSTLVFANNRRTTEKLTRLLNETEEGLAYSHHGSLSREIRAVVEERLKDGRLAAIVATNSLELGIDIGALDEVLLVSTPPSVASAVQRVGRAGHGVGEVSRARLYPFFARDLLDAAVVARAILDQEVEELAPVELPLDVLTQVVLSMVAAETWDLDRLFNVLRAAEPFHRLSRRQFDLVLEMLAGRYAGSSIRELAPRVSIDRAENRVRGRPGAARWIYLSGGTIPDRGYFQLRLRDTMARIGELDEEFVWERSLGDTFALGAQAWRIRQITHNDVLVTPAGRASAMAPFWRAEAANRSFFLSEKIARFLELAEGSLATRQGRDALRQRLESEHRLDEAARDALVELLERQRAAAGGELPHRRHLVIEHVSDPTSEASGRQLVLHTLWGGRVNQPFAIALSAAWEERRGFPLTVEHTNDCLAVELPDGTGPQELLEWVREDNLDELLRRRLESTGFFGARFRENAGRALLLPRADFRRRVPLWLNRQRSKRLLEAVSAYQDFPVLAETWRTCLKDEFDLDALRGLLGELARGEIRVSEVTTSEPSPFADGLVWKQTNRLMYEDDTPEGRSSRLAGDLVRELVHSPSLRPRLPAELLERFQRKLQRLFPGYAPRTADELAEWVGERLLLPWSEWQQLRAAAQRDGWELAEGEHDVLESRLVALPQAGAETLVVMVDRLPRVTRGLGVEPRELELRSIADGSSPAPAAERRLEALLAAPAPAAPAQEQDEPATLLGEWLRWYGPLPEERVHAVFRLAGGAVVPALESLVEEERLVVDRFRQEDESRELCDAENLERLLRILRAESRPSFTARPLSELPLLLAVQQGLAVPRDGVEGLKAALEGLFGYPAPVRLWETDFFPARLDPYYPAWLDALFQESELTWVGCGEGRLTFAFESDLDLLRQPSTPAEPPEALTGLVEQLGGSASLEEMARRGDWTTAELVDRLWPAVWAGQLTQRSFLAVRQGVRSDFRVAEAVAGPAAAAGRRPRRGRFDRWRAARPLGGEWRTLPVAEEELDALDVEELGKDRARWLLERYGLVFRELVARELPELGWRAVFRALRIMELSGEVLSGYFFEDLPGPQFLSHAAFRRLSEGLPVDAVFWVNALDPASPCGLGLEALPGLPARVPSTHLVYHGPRPVVVSKRHGGELEIAVEADHPRLLDYLGFLKVLLTRQSEPRKLIEIETVNGEPALGNPYVERLREIFDITREAKSVRLRRRY